MKIRKILIFTLGMLGMSLVSCNNSKSYAELLTDENMAANRFLANQRVVPEIPADTVFECGVDAPYYQLDEEGNIFMQVLNPGTPGNKAKNDQLIYFRFMRYSLYSYPGNSTDKWEGEGNDSDMTAGNSSFRFANFSTQSSYQWGEGLQTPLIYLPIDCEVNLVVKSQKGLYNEIAMVVPYLYRIRYFKSQI